MDKELTLNLRIDPSPECLKRLCDALTAAVKPDGGYKAATSDDSAIGDGGDQMVQVEWWIPQHGCDSLENTLDAIKGRLLIAVRDWWETALARGGWPEVEELVAVLEADAECVAAEQPDLMQLSDKQLRRIAELLKGTRALPAPGFQIGPQECIPDFRPAREVQGVLADRYEFSVLDSDDCEQAGGSAPTLDGAIQEGRNYLRQCNQDGPHKLELRRVLVLDHSEATNDHA